MKLKFLILSSLFLTGCFFSESSNKTEIQLIRGEIFGSYYQIKYRGDLDRSTFERELSKFFSEFNQEFSTYDKNSIVSKFNESKAFEKYKVSPRFLEMLKLVKVIHHQTEGAFDPTIGPLIRLWGFGGADQKKIPSEFEIKNELENVGFQNISWDEKTNEIWKVKNEIRLDLNAFAPGWAADLIGDLLKSHKVIDYLVDISGELVASGEKSPNNPWVVGIEKPNLKYASGVQVALKISNESIATSGNYRQFYNESGKKITHIINPKTGRSVDHFICSATVIGKTGFETDAWSTALMVLGHEGINLAEKKGLRVFLLEQKSPKEFKEIISESMKNYIRTHSL